MSLPLPCDMYIHTMYSILFCIMYKYMYNKQVRTFHFIHIVFLIIRKTTVNNNNKISMTSLS